MSRTFYSYAIFFAALAGILILGQGIVYFVIGSRIMELASTRPWVFLVLMVTAASWLTMIVYFRYREYQFSLWAAVAVVTMSALQAFSLLKILRTHEITALYALTTLLTIVVGIVFAMSLLFSK